MHSSLRSLNFWRMMLINFLVSTIIYMSLPLWPSVVEQELLLTSSQVGWSILLFCAGLVVPGCVCSYLLDAYKRKSVCFWLIVALTATCVLIPLGIPFRWVLLLRFLQGVAFCMFHIALGNTIMVDITVSERRDFASYIYFWICRFALAIGPLLGVLMFSSLSLLSPDYAHYVHWMPFVGVILAVYFIIRLEVPFRTPVRSEIFSFDRFWLRHCTPLVGVLFATSFCVGIQMACNAESLYFIYLLMGFVVSLILHFSVFYRADIRAEVVTGFLCFIASFLLLISDETDGVLIAAGLSGYGLANVSGKLLKFFTMVSDHTERGCAQGTYKLTFECALCTGFSVACFWQVESLVFNIICLFISIISLGYYVWFVHPWFLRSKKR